MSHLTCTKPDEWECSCGNRTDLDGFHMCDQDGNDEPLALDSEYWRCDRCGTVYVDEEKLA